MSRVFIEPESEELTEAGVLQATNAEGEQELFEGEELNGELPENFKALWKTLEHLPREQVLERIAEEFSDAPDRRREVLTTWMAQELGYSRVWRRRSSLTREPLWDVLSTSVYEELSPRGEEAVAMIGRSLRPTRSYLHPSAALATLAVWRHADEGEARWIEAQKRLEKYALPDEPEWLFEMAGAFLEDQAEGEEGTTKARGRSLEELIEFVLEHSYWGVAALLSGLALVHKYGKWYHSAVVSNLVHATEVASQQYPQEAAPWLNYLADAAMGGKLSYSWLEEPVKACIRLSIDEPEREQKLRIFLGHRLFDADHRRLESLYAAQLDALRADEGSEQARRRLFEEVLETVENNPSRALRLLELMALYTSGRRVGSQVYRLRQAIDDMGRDDELDELESWLIGLYVYNATLESHAAGLVRRGGQRVDWESNPFASRDDYSMYLVISDYERAFEELTCKFDGVTLAHADKYAAARIQYFVQKRLDPSRIHQLVQKVFTPVEWLGSGLTEIGVVRTAIERGMERFEVRVQRQDLREHVLQQFKDAGADVEDFEDIEHLTVDTVEDVLKSQRQRRLLLGAVAGGISGGLAPFSWGVLSLADIPVMLSITADICSRFCWFFGFDPREYPELPMEILAVALGGTRPAAIEPMLVRQNLHGFVMRKSLVVGALAHGGMAHLTGRGLSRVIEKQVGHTAMHKAGELARRAVTRNLQRRAVKAAPSRTLPVVGAFLGAALNTALLYDISEAAQAVLTDRFLERKYPEWARHIAREGQRSEEHRDRR